MFTCFSFYHPSGGWLRKRKFLLYIQVIVLLVVWSEYIHKVDKTRRKRWNKRKWQEHNHKFWGPSQFLWLRTHTNFSVPLFHSSHSSSCVYLHLFWWFSSISLRFPVSLCSVSWVSTHSRSSFPVVALSLASSQGPGSSKVRYWCPSVRKPVLWLPGEKSPKKTSGIISRS